MSAPFIALTTPMAGFDPRPVFINAQHIRKVQPRLVRKIDTSGAEPASIDLSGSWITIGPGEGGGFPVCENYGEVTGAIRDAFRAPSVQS